MTTSSASPLEQLKEILTIAVTESNYNGFKHICRRQGFPEGPPQELRTDFIDRFLVEWNGRTLKEIAAAHNEIAEDGRFSAITEICTAIASVASVYKDFKINYGKIVAAALEKMGKSENGHSKDFSQERESTDKEFNDPKVAQINEIVTILNKKGKADEKRFQEIGRASVELGKTVKDYDGEINFNIKTIESLQRIQTQALSASKRSSTRPLLRNSITEMLEQFGVGQNLHEGMWQEEDDEKNLEQIIRSGKEHLSGRVIKSINTFTIDRFLRAVVSFLVRRNIPLHEDEPGSYVPKHNIEDIQGTAEKLGVAILLEIRDVAAKQFRGIEEKIAQLSCSTPPSATTSIKEVDPKPRKSRTDVMEDAK